MCKGGFSFIAPLSANILKQNAPHLYNKFSMLVGVFNYTWFGKKAIDRQSYENNRIEALELIRESGAAV